MNFLNIDFLINSPTNKIFSKLNNIFEDLLKKISIYLDLDFIYKKVTIEIIETSEEFKINFINFGVLKTYKEGNLSIFIFNNFKKYIYPILLREAYKCFIPLQLQENEIVNIFIDQKVEIDLQNFDFIEEWKELRLKNVINYEFMKRDFDNLDKFLKQESTGTRISPFQFFFLYVRKYIQTIGDIKQEFYDNKTFYDKIFEEYSRKYTGYNDDILETIRIITKIFYEVKSYRSLLDYKQYFKKFRESGIIQTSLSLKKFTELMHWIKNFSTIAPCYQINWSTLGITIVLCTMKFHPAIDPKKVRNFIKQLPFLIMPSNSRNYFGMEVKGYFLFPKVYLNDLINLLVRLESNGYLIENKFYIISKSAYLINLNYFRSFLSRNILISPNKRNYRKEFEIEFEFNYGMGIFRSEMSLFDWLLIDRLHSYSITGLGFERKNETLNTLKSDLLSEVQSQKNLIKEVKTNLNKISNSIALRKKVLELIDFNKKFGFFYIKKILNEYVSILDIIYKLLLDNPSIINFFQLQELVKNKGITNLIEDNVLLKKLNLRPIKDFISLYFKSKNGFKKILEEYRNIYKLIKSFYDLKIFNLESIKSIINDKSLITKIYRSKEEKLKKSYESYRLYKITNHALEQRLEDFINNDPPVIKPQLISTIVPFPSNYYPTLFLKYNSETIEGIKKIKRLFPLAIITELSEYESHNKYIHFQICMSNLRSNEKKLFYSILYRMFNNNIISVKSYLMSGFMESFSRKDFYDLEKEDFFYTKDLFEQIYLYSKKIFKRELNPISKVYGFVPEDLWAKERYLSRLISLIEKRMSKEHIDLNNSSLYNLLLFNNNLYHRLLNVEEFKHSKNQYFFQNYIKAIKFIPSFQNFGFGQYFLYFYPIDLKKVDFKHLLHNAFQKIKFPASIERSNSFFIKFIYPYRNPNVSLLNWQVKSKKVVREYCLFFIKKVFQIFHFNYNLSANEWDLDPNRFRIHFQNILFNPEYELSIPQLSEFNVGDLYISNYVSPESPEFEALSNLYGCKSKDIKALLGTRNYTLIKHIIRLLEKKLIFPFISVKNLNLIEKIYLIIPNIKKEYNKKILKIFSYFNIGFIYEIEGDYYINGIPEEKKFENGLMIKLYLPDCRLNEFEKLFDLIFEYLEIKHYIIMNDLVDGKDFLASIYGNLDFLKLYNPIKNLIWNNRDKIWMNHKLFDGNFGKIYPKMHPKG